MFDSEGGNLRSNGDPLADVEYTAGFYREMAPSHLAFAAIATGYVPGLGPRPRRMLELGFGQGFGLALLAAANPDVEFEGCDANAEHVAHARRLIADAGLSNIAVSQSGFEQAAARGGDADVDVIALHGVLSWISHAARDAVVAIARQRLRPDGLLYVSYNCMPGWAPMEPIRRLALAVKQRVAGGSLDQLKTALGILSGLRAGKAVYFAASAAAARHLDGMLAMDPRYLVHEYLGEHWEPLHFVDVASQMAGAGLSYAASATLTENLDQCAVPKDLLPMIAQTTDPLLRETLRDLAANKQFRRDVYARGGGPLGADERRRAWAQIRFVLVVPRARVTFKFLGPLTELNGNPLLYAPLVDRLDQSAASFEELLNASAAGESQVGLLMECLTLLVHSGQVLPVMPGAEADAAPAKRFNRMVVEHAREGRVFDNLAAPVIRTGVPVSDFGLLALSALFEGKGHDAQAAGAHGLSILQALGRRPLKNLQPIERDNDAIDFLAEYMRPILDEAVPLWRRLGAL
jgi:SAM-dependent methyltransferase